MLGGKWNYTVKARFIRNQSTLKGFELMNSKFKTPNARPRQITVKYEKKTGGVNGNGGGGHKIRKTEGDIQNWTARLCVCLSDSIFDV